MLNELKHQPIFLVGFMGSGKTHWGRQWAGYLHRKFIDLDQLIESIEQLQVGQIFEKNGETWFREKEAITLRSVIDENNILVACGGGTPCFHDNMDFMNETGFTIFLDAAPKFLLANIMRDSFERPLLKNMSEAEMLFFIEKKLVERNVFYSQAKLTMNAEELNEESIKKL
ncbi:MAG: shikimate kinase [Rhizobacter sp.]|nr:shikimate kinase [Ferruginibacter sp.]